MIPEMLLLVVYTEIQSHESANQTEQEHVITQEERKAVVPVKDKIRRLRLAGDTWTVLRHVGQVAEVHGSEYYALQRYIW